MLEGDVKPLWNAFVGGDDEALHSLYTHFVDVLYAFGLRFTGDTDLVKDSIQDLFVDLHKYRFSLALDVEVKSYLFTSLKRKIYNLLKKQAREQSILELPFLLSVEDAQDHEEDDRSELKEILRKQLEFLPDRQKEVLYLRYHSELEYEEIAEIMNISTATCRTLVYRGVKQLRERMVVKHLYKFLASLFLFFFI